MRWFGPFRAADFSMPSALMRQAKRWLRRCSSSMVRQKSSSKKSQLQLWTFEHLDTFGYGYIWNIRWSLIAETLVPLCAISRLSSPRSTGDPGDPGDPRNRSSKSCTLSDTSTRCEDSRLAMCWNTFIRYVLDRSCHNHLASCHLCNYTLVTCDEIDPWNQPHFPKPFFLLSLFTPMVGLQFPSVIQLLQLSRYRHSIVTSVVNLFAELLTGHGSATPSGPLRVASTWHSESRGLKSEVEVC